MILYIEGTNQDKDDRRMGEGKSDTFFLQKGEVYIVVPYPIRFYTHAVSMDRHQ